MVWVLLLWQRRLLLLLLLLLLLPAILNCVGTRLHVAASTAAPAAGSSVQLDRSPPAAWVQLRMAQPASGYVVCLEGASGSSICVDTYLLC